MADSVQKLEALIRATLDRQRRVSAAVLRTIPAILPVRTTVWTDYRVSSRFGMRWHPLTGRWLHHAGIDLPQPTGASVYATADGRVSRLIREPQGLGLAVTITHASGFQTVYGHLSRQWVQVGQSVKRGQPVGAVGSTGRATGLHLHYTILRRGKAGPRKAVDPTRFCFLLLDHLFLKPERPIFYQKEGRAGSQ